MGVDLKLLVADIGGTNARFGYQENNKSEIKHIEFLNCIDFANIGQAIAHYVSKNTLIILVFRNVQDLDTLFTKFYQAKNSVIQIE